MPSTCRGFRFGALSAGIKKKAGALDLAMIVADEPATAAAVFTSNRIKAAPVLVSRAALRRNGGRARAVVVNSGNANACTGPAGLADARQMASTAAAALDSGRSDVLVASTGVIGAPLPMARVTTGIDSLVTRLTRNGFNAFADGILTTDRGRKIASRTVKLGGQRITLLGCTKGAGMIAPNMATTLSFVVTDARIGAGALRDALAEATRATYNAIIVDGDTSTNDMILVMASGAAANSAARGRDARRFTGILTELLDDLAHQLMRDGEGVHHVVTVRVRGARNQHAAERVARSIATSPLVKTAISGCDPNWGRILCAAGYAGPPIAPDRLELHIGDVPVVRAGQAVDDPRTEARAAAVMKAPAYEVLLDLHQGRSEARYLACDLSHEYVSINADYRS